MAIDDDIAFLERVPTIGVLGRPALRILAIGAETRRLRDGEALFGAGDPADGGYVIQAGRFSLRSSEDGNERTVGPCTLLGEVALFTETNRHGARTGDRAVHSAAAVHQDVGQLSGGGGQIARGLGESIGPNSASNRQCRHVSRHARTELIHTSSVAVTGT